MPVPLRIKVTKTKNFISKLRFEKNLFDNSNVKIGQGIREGCVDKKPVHV